MIWRLALRYSFSPVNGHRGRALRIVISFALSSAVLMVVLSVMLYLQDGRFDRIRSFSSFDIVISGDYEAEMEKRFPSADVFVYGEAEAMGEGEAYTVRYIGEDYPLPSASSAQHGLVVPYSVYSRYGDSMPLTMLRMGGSGMMLPRTEDTPIEGAYTVPPGASTGLPIIFLPLSAAEDGTRMHTAVSGVDASLIDELRSDGFEGLSWKEKESGLYSAFLAERVMMYAVLSLLFIIILVSMKQAVRISAASRRTERAELAVLGMGRNSAALVFALSFLIVLAVSLAAGFLLSLISLPLAQAAVQGIFAGAELAMPYRHFAVLAALMVLMTAVFSAAIEARERRIDIMEVLSDDE